MRTIDALRWLWLLLGALDLVALKAGWMSHHPALLAVLLVAALVAFLARVIELARSLPTEPRRVRAVAAIVGSVGIVVALLAGTANWSLSLQGFAILNEGESVALHGGTALQQFDAGPLARVEEMGLHLVLEEVKLVPAGPDGFFPESRLLVWREHQEPRQISVTPRVPAAHETLWFFQGAFGFAPRIVIVKKDEGESEETVFDQLVPFTTERRGPAGISFNGLFMLEAERLLVEGIVDLATLDEGMRGHATLHLAVSREGETLGSGKLLPGHFAEIGEGYRIGFAGLEQWSEIVISRRNYGRLVLAGGIVALLGGMLWLLASWRGW